jgi:hypothetical protein
VSHLTVWDEGVGGGDRLETAGRGDIEETRDEDRDEADDRECEPTFDALAIWSRVMVDFY